MSLLGNIAAALSAGVGDGMVGAGKWGIEEEAQRKKEAADDARLQEQMKRYDADRESRDKQYERMNADSKEERLSRAEQAAADRDLQWRIANLRNSSGGGGGSSNLFKGLEFVDGRIADFDKSIGLLSKARDEEMDPQRQAAIDAQIDVFKQQRQSFITNPATLKILDSSGEYGQAYKASLFGVEPEQGADQQGGANIPESLIPAPQRRVVKPDDSLTSKGLLNGMSNEMRTPSPQAATGQPQSGDPILRRVSQDLGSVADGAAGVYNWLDNKFNPVREGRYIGGN